MNKKLMTMIASAALLFSCEKAFSSGFFLIEQSVSGMGTAYANGSAYAEDASTIWFNPAGLTSICGTQLVAGVHGVIPVADYDDQGSMAISEFSAPALADPNAVPTAYQPLTSYLNQGNDDGRNGGEWALVPQTYFSKQISNCLWFGLGITSPYGLTTDYKDNWRGRYHAIRSSVLTINLNPSFAWKVNKCLSIGAGFSAMYLHAKLTNAVDFGLIGQYQFGNGVANPNPPPDFIIPPAAAFGLAPQQNDGQVELKGNSWGYGGNVGVIYEPCCGTRLGISWRSEVKHKVDGSEKFKDVPYGITASGLGVAFQDTRAKADITLPMQLSVSGYHAFNRCFAVMADITWTRWSSLQELRFEFDNPAQSDGVTTFNWNDSLRYSLGVHYRPNDCFIARLGVAYDETPIPDAAHRTPRVPGEDRFWVATGFGYNINACTRFDVGYAHLFVSDPKIDKLTDLESTPEDWFRGGLLGEYDAKTDIISAQVVVNF